MKISSAIELIWNLAAQEAVAGEFREIEPEHLCIAILKFAEISPQEEKIAQVRQMGEEIRAVRMQIDSQRVDTTIARRRLRTMIGTGGQPYAGGGMHRSQASREIFDAAATLADTTGSEVLLVSHLWSALLACPTEAILQVMGDKTIGAPVRSASTPLLNEGGRDWIQFVTESKAPAGTDRFSEAKALVRALSRSSGKSVLLIVDDSDAATRVFARLAQMMTMRDCPPALKGRCLLEVPLIVTRGESPSRITERLEQLLFEASHNRIILILSSIAQDTNYSVPGEAIDLIQSTIADGKVQCIWCVSRQTYESLCGSETVRRRRAEVIWVGGERTQEIPKEL